MCDGFQPRYADDIGTVVEDDGSATPFRVEAANGKRWWYKSEAIEKIDGDGVGSDNGAVLFTISGLPDHGGGVRTWQLNGGWCRSHENKNGKAIFTKVGDRTKLMWFDTKWKMKCDGSGDSPLSSSCSDWCFECSQGDEGMLPPLDGWEPVLSSFGTPLFSRAEQHAHAPGAVKLTNFKDRNGAAVGHVMLRRTNGLCNGKAQYTDEAKEYELRYSGDSFFDWVIEHHGLYLYNSHMNEGEAAPTSGWEVCNGQPPVPRVEYQ